MNTNNSDTHSITMNSEVYRNPAVLPTPAVLRALTAETGERRESDVKNRTLSLMRVAALEGGTSCNTLLPLGSDCLDAIVKWLRDGGYTVHTENSSDRVILRISW